MTYEEWKKLEDALENFEDFLVAQKKFSEYLIDNIFDVYNKFYFREDVDLKKFRNISHKELKLMAGDFFDRFLTLIRHYNENETRFLKIENLKIPRHKEDLTEEEIQKFKKDFKFFSEEDFNEFIEETRDDRKFKYDYEKQFNDKIKEIITDYIFNINSLPGIAFRELDYLCYDIFCYFEHKLQDIQYRLRTKKLEFQMQ